MKTLILIRHAQAEHSQPGLSDKFRPLSEKGHEEAEKVSKNLSKIYNEADIIMSSDAVRTQQTAAYFQKYFQLKESDILWNPDIYQASEDDLRYLVQSIENIHNTVVLIGHNPTMSRFASFLTSNATIEFTTGAISVIKLKIDRWDNLSYHSGKLVFFLCP